MVEIRQDSQPLLREKVIVFAGPTLPRTLSPEWSQLLGRAEVRPPAQRGDILNALCQDPHTLVLLDGYYFTVPAVTHKELLYALEAGVRVIGSASMGALRAAELHLFGMEGVGWIFDQFFEGHLDGDDEVAVLHATEDFHFRPLTVALVDVRDALLHLVNNGLEEERAEALISHLKALPFIHRHGHEVQSRARVCLGEEFATELEERLRKESAKERDALEALRRAFDSKKPSEKLIGSQTTRPGKGATEGATDTSTATTFLGFFQEWHLEVPGGPPETPCTFRQAAHALQVIHPASKAAISAIRQRLLLATAARRRGQVPDPQRVKSLRQRLDSALGDLHGNALLPAPERFDEATSHGMAEVALEHFGSRDNALLYMAQEIGLEAEEGVRSLEELLTLQDDLLPAWWIARSLACTTAFPQAVALARAAAQIHLAFQTWKQGARIQKTDLDDLAAELWNCPRSHVLKEAGGRGLFEAGGFSPGFRSALELIAAAEKLPRTINTYPETRQALREAPIRFLLP